jgi:hypothetical protein
MTTRGSRNSGDDKVNMLTKTQMDLVGILKRDPLPEELAFPPAEYQRRGAATQGLMKARGIDFLIVSMTPNLGYLTGYDTTMPSGWHPRAKRQCAASRLGARSPLRAPVLDHRGDRCLLLV